MGSVKRERIILFGKCNLNTLLSSLLLYTQGTFHSYEICWGEKGNGNSLIGDRWVKTANGQNFADSIGVSEPPMTLEQSVSGVLAQVCGFLARI
jgi:hypothetical protein